MSMLHRSFVTMASLSALAFALGGANTAQAHWFSHGSSGGSHGSHGGSWGSHGSSGGSYGSSGGYSYGSSGGSWGSHGSSGGSYGSSGGSYGSSGGSYGSSGGSWGSHGSSGGYYAAANVPTTAAANTLVAYLNVKVPADAKVYLQDQLMTITGPQRRYVTPTLADDSPRVYTVKIEIARKGKTIVKTLQAPIKAGQEVEIAASIDDERNPTTLVASVTPAATR